MPELRPRTRLTANARWAFAATSANTGGYYAFLRSRKGNRVRSPAPPDTGCGKADHRIGVRLALMVAKQKTIESGYSIIKAAGTPEEKGVPAV